MEAENCKLKHVCAELSLDRKTLKDIVEKSWGPTERRGLAKYAIDVHAPSKWAACHLLGLNRTGFCCPAKRPDDSEIQVQLRKLADRKPH